jgi:hypothetical protein
MTLNRFTRGLTVTPPLMLHTPLSLVVLNHCHSRFNNDSTTGDSHATQRWCFTHHFRSWFVTVLRFNSDSTALVLHKPLGLFTGLDKPWVVQHQISIPINRRARCKSSMKLGKVARLLSMRLRKPFPGTPQHFLAFCPWTLSLSKLAAYSAFKIRQMYWHPSLKTNKKRFINPLSVILVITNNNSSNLQDENINDLRKSSYSYSDNPYQRDL